MVSLHATASCPSGMRVHKPITHSKIASPFVYKSVPAKSLPPYGKILTERLARPGQWPQYWGTSPDGSSVSIFVVVGTRAWRVANSWIKKRLLVISPPGEDPALFDWSLLASHEPVLMYCAGPVRLAEMDCLAAAVLRDGAFKLQVIGQDGLRYLATRDAL